MNDEAVSEMRRLHGMFKDGNKTAEAAILEGMRFAYADAVSICHGIDEGAGYGTGAHEAKKAIEERMK